MRPVELVVDTNVVSYLFRRSAQGFAYERLIGDRRRGITGSTLAELRAGSRTGNWDCSRLEALLEHLQGFTHIPETREMSEVCGAIRAERRRIGRPIDWPDAWAAACALWLDVPLVTHDRDLEGIPGLRVETLHETWRVGEPDYWELLSSGPPSWHVSQAQWPHLRASVPTMRQP
jgi:predicted nucleic acid-binding protein